MEKEIFDAIYFIDLDGTLLDVGKINKNKSISKTNLLAIQKARNNNKEVVISTGRMGVRAIPFIKMTNSKYAILGNGSQIWNSGKIIQEFILTKQQIFQIYNFAQLNKLSLKIDDDFNAWGVNNFLNKLITLFLGYVPNEGFNFNKEVNIYKIVLWGKTKKNLKKIQKTLLKNFDNNISVVSSAKGYTLEITSNLATKGLASKWILENIMSAKNNNTFHVGDTMNDSSTKKNVKTLIAMKNGDKDLKKIADEIGPNYKQGGVAKILNKLN